MLRGQCCSAKVEDNGEIRVRLAAASIQQLKGGRGEHKKTERGGLKGGRKRCGGSETGREWTL